MTEWNHLLSTRRCPGWSAYQELWWDGDGRPHEAAQGGAEAEVVVDQHWERGHVMEN